MSYKLQLSPQGYIVMSMNPRFLYMRALICTRYRHFLYTKTL